MRRTLMLSAVAALMAFTGSANAVLTNGDWATADETGWTRWGSGRPVETWTVTNVGPSGPEGSLTGFNAGAGPASFGWYQVVQIPAGVTAEVDALWTGNSIGWAEVMLWTVASAPSHNDVNQRADAGANEDIAFKRDAFGLHTPTWDWQLASLSDHPSANDGSVVSQGYVVVALKLGNHTDNTATFLRFDNLTLTPEPAAALLLLAGLPLMRRRRA